MSVNNHIEAKDKQVSENQLVLAGNLTNGQGQIPLDAEQGEKQNPPRRSC